MRKELDSIVTAIVNRMKDFLKALDARHYFQAVFRRHVLILSLFVVGATCLSSCEKEEELGLPGLPTWPELIEMVKDSIVYLCEDDFNAPSRNVEAWIQFNAPQGTFCSPRLSDPLSSGTSEVAYSFITNGPILNTGDTANVVAFKHFSMWFDGTTSGRWNDGPLRRYRPTVIVDLGIQPADSSDRALVTHALNRDTIFLDPRRDATRFTLDPKYLGGYGNFQLSCQWCHPAKYDNDWNIRNSNYSVLQLMPIHCENGKAQYFIVEEYTQTKMADGLIMHSAVLSFDFEVCPRFISYDPVTLNGERLANGRMGVRIITAD